MIPKDIIERLAHEIWHRKKYMGFHDADDDRANWYQAEIMLNRYLEGEEMGLGAYLSDEDCVVLEAMKISYERIIT